MKQFEISIGLFIRAEDVDEMWNRFHDSGLHDLLNHLDAEDGYESEVVGEVDVIDDVAQPSSDGVLSPFERLNLVREVYHAIYDDTESFEMDNAGSHLSYLLGAISTDDIYEIQDIDGMSPDEAKFVERVNRLFQTGHEVHKFIHINKG